MQLRSNPDLKVAGILLTRYNPRETISNLIRETATDLAVDLGMPLLDSHISTSVGLTKAQILQKDMMMYAARNRAVNDYRLLVKELIRRGVLQNHG